MSSDLSPVREPDGWAQLKISISELNNLASRLSAMIDGFPDDWLHRHDCGQLVDTCERTWADLATAAGEYVRLRIEERSP